VIRTFHIVLPLEVADVVAEEMAGRRYGCLEDQIH